MVKRSKGFTRKPRKQGKPSKNQHEKLFSIEDVKIGTPLKIRLPKDFTVTEAVNHPAHYGGKDNPYETIKVLEARLTREEFIGAMKFQVYKYNDRALMKGDELENYEKAAFYQNYLVAYVKKN